MDLRQQKLTAEEWDALERPVSKDEHRILEMIQSGYENINILFNDTQSLINFIKFRIIRKCITRISTISTLKKILINLKRSI